MGPVTRLADKAGVLGSTVSAMGCASCFPVIASLGAAIGLGFLSQYEGLFSSILLPLFAGVSLLANGIGWLSHQHLRRAVLGLIGLLQVLAAVYLTVGRRSELLLYVGLAFMAGVSIWDVVSLARQRCGSAACEPPGRRG